MLQFDTHKVYKKFKEAGIEDRAADAFVEAINEARATDLENLATKQDIADIRKDLANAELKLELRFADFKSEVKQEIADVKSELKTEITKEFDKLYNMGKFILALVLIPIGIKIIELFLPRMLQ